MSNHVEVPNVSRRRLLKGAGWAVALPLLPSLAPRNARAQAPAPKRLVLWWMPDGALPNSAPITSEGGENFSGEPGVGRWFPTGGTETDFSLPMLSAPLEAVKRDIILIRGVDTGFQRVAGCPHEVAPRFSYTGMGPMSIDYLVGKDMPTRFKQLQLGVGTWKFNVDPSVRVHYSNGAPVEPVNNPNKTFMMLFGDPSQIKPPPVTPGAPAPVADEALLRLQKRRKSVLDHVLAELQDVRGKLGSRDKQNLDYYTTALRDVETSLGDLSSNMSAMVPGVTAEAVAATCKMPRVDLSQIDGLTVFDAEASGGSLANFDKVAALQVQLLTLAIQCDQTRVASIQFEKGRSGQRYTFLGSDIKEDNHGYSHTYYRNPGGPGEKALERIQVWRTQLFADFVKSLQSTPDVDGRMLIENVGVIKTSEISTNGHGFKNLPIVLAGRMGGALKTGRYVDVAAANGGAQQMQLKLYLTMARKMGASIAQFPEAGGPYVQKDDLQGLG